MMPRKRGFGSRLIEQALAQDLAGDVNLQFESQGVICTIGTSLDEIRGGAETRRAERYEGTADRRLKLQAPENGLSGRRVFIVEDESMVTMMLQDTLADIGCEVVGVAFRYPDAFAKAKSLSFDVALLDVNLNGQYTFPIAGILTERGMPFVFSTGYGAASIPPSFQAPVLQKPFQQPDLERALRTALGVQA